MAKERDAEKCKAFLRRRYTELGRNEAALREAVANDQFALNLIPEMLSALGGSSGSSAPAASSHTGQTAGPGKTTPPPSAIVKPAAPVIHRPNPAAIHAVRGSGSLEFGPPAAPLR